jgi:hypothetical protein
MHPIDELLATVESIGWRTVQDSDAEWRKVCELDAEIAVAATQGFPDVPLSDCEAFGFCRIPLLRSMDGFSLITGPDQGKASSQWRQAMAILRRTVPPRKPATEPDVTFPMLQKFSGFNRQCFRTALDVKFRRGKKGNSDGYIYAEILPSLRSHPSTNAVTWPPSVAELTKPENTRK